MTQSPTDRPPSPEMEAAIARAGLVPGRSPSPVLLPRPDRLFAGRARRLRTLAGGHSLADWLRFVASLSEASAGVVAGPATHAPDRQWTEDLRALLDRLSGLPPAAAVACDSLKAAPERDIRAMATHIRHGHAAEVDLAAAPLLAAARQVAWTRHAAGLDAAAVTPPATATVCPVCGEAPVAGMIHIGATSGGLRYLHCGCCGTAWHHVRAVCVACGNGKGIDYRMIEGGNDGVRAECCPTCKNALKLFLLEKDPDFDPVADDLASLPLDILVGEDGFTRIGGNPFLVMAAA